MTLDLIIRLEVIPLQVKVFTKKTTYGFEIQLTGVKIPGKEATEYYEKIDPTIEDLSTALSSFAQTIQNLLTFNPKLKTVLFVDEAQVLISF